MLERMYDSTFDIICEVQNKMLKFTLNMFELFEKDTDKVHLIYSELKKFMIQLKQNLKEIFNQKDLQLK